MGSTNKKEVIALLKERFPNAAIIEIEYTGAGDNFDSFYACYVMDENGHSVVKDGSEEQEAIDIAADYMFHIMDNANNQPDFNNDGSEGKVTFDLINRVVTLEVVYLEDVTPEFEGDDDDPDYDEKYDEYWDNVERETEGTPMPPEIF